MKTRARKPAAASKAKPDEAAKATLQTLEASVEKPPKVFILPKNISRHARILSLPHSVTGRPTRYLACPRHGFYEFTKIAAPKGACRSWLLASDRTVLADDDGTGATQEEQTLGQDDEGYVLQTPELFIATPIDPLFLVLPALWPDHEQGYRTFHDRMFLDESLPDRYIQLQGLLNARGGKALQQMLERRMAAVCHSHEMGERHYHLDVEKLGSVLREKAKKMVKVGLPASLEEKLVRQPLEVPVLSVKREESGISLVSGSVANATEEEGATAAGTAPETGATTSETDSITDLLRIRTALDFVLASYVPSDLRAKVDICVRGASKPETNFRPLDDHLAKIAKLKNEAQALRSISDNVSRKRGALDDEEALEKAETKKRKKEEEEARKKNVSHAVKKLAKVNTTGMKKMSNFFAKAPAKK